MINLEMMGQKAEAASFELQGLSKEKKNEVLQKTGETLIADTESILKENEKDIANGESNGMHPGMVDRLRLTADRIKSMAEGLYQILELEDPIGEVLETYDRPNGLHIQKRRVPLGVVGIIYESRPNVTADAFGLCFKSGNAVILKGGSDAVCSNIAIAASIRKALRSCGV